MAAIPTIQLVRDFKRMSRMTVIGARARLFDVLCAAIWEELELRAARAAGLFPSANS